MRRWLCLESVTDEPVYAGSHFHVNQFSVTKGARKFGNCPSMLEVVRKTVVGVGHSPLDLL